MATIIPFLRDQNVFGPDVTQAMSVAFDEICQKLKLDDARGRETIATRIIELARRGERDAVRLSERVLREAGGVV
jgi:hypothetical protein